MLPGGSANTKSIAVADVDGDGDLDVLVAIEGGPCRVLLNAGGGTFPTSIALPYVAGEITRSIAAADLDGDGDLDVLLGNFGRPSRVLLNAGGGAVTATNFTSSLSFLLPGGNAQTNSIMAADVDGDGDLDVLLGNSNSPTLSSGVVLTTSQVVLNVAQLNSTHLSGCQAAACFPRNVALPAPLADTSSIAAADVDGDGDLDVLLGNAGSPSRVLLNAGGGTFPTSITLPGGSAETESIAAADVDGDGDLDVLLGISGTPSRVLFNAGGGQGGGCSNTCEDASNAACDDGGPLSYSSICPYGTDCFDCGPRQPLRFPTSSELPGGAAPTRSIAAADVDGDGDLDVLLGNYGDGIPSRVLINAGDGTFPTSIELTKESLDTNSIAAADLDGDGDIDLLLGNDNSPSRLLLTTGDGTFPTSTVLPGNLSNTFSIVSADIDGDGDLDVLLGNLGSPSRVLLNAGDGTFPTSVTLPGGSANTRSIAVADLDGDGDLDVLLGNENSPSRLLRKTGNSYLSTMLPGNVAVTSSIAAADVDGDGDLDVLLGNADSPSRVLLNAGDGTFPTSITLPGSTNTYSIAAADMDAADVDGDGDLDVLLGNEGSPNQVLRNDGGGTFVSIELPGGSTKTYSIAAADVDGDGDLDVLLGNKGFSGVMLNSGGGTVTASTFPQQLSIELPGGSAWTRSIAAADVDGDGDLDVLLGNDGSFQGSRSRVVPFTRCSAFGTARSRYGNGCVRCPAPSSRRDDAFDVCSECDEHSQVDGSGENPSLSDVTLMTSPDQCVACPIGTSCSVGSAVAVPCAPGTYNNRSRQETCLKCAAGSFQMLAGQTSCSPCTPGYYCAEGAATPVPCPGGKFNNRTGLESADGCVPVGFGYWAPTGSVFPIPCPSGFSCPGYFNDVNTSGSQPLILPTGGLTPVVAVETQTVETITGSISLNAPLSSFLNDTALQLQYRQTLAAQLGIPWQDLQLDFSEAPPSAGRRLQTGSTVLTYIIVRTVTTNPTAPRPDTNSSNATTSNVTTSGPPFVAPSFALNNLDPAVLGAALGVSVAALMAPTATVVQQTVTVIRERVCPRGFWCTAGVEVACEQGFYNPNTNAASQTACLRCPEFSTTNGTAATNVSECVCQASFVRQMDAAGSPQCVCAAGRELIGGVQCAPCKIGTYKDWTGENFLRNPLGPQKCLDCPVPQTTTEQEGADSISQCVCEVGTFASLTRAEMMQATNDSSGVAADAFECRSCVSIQDSGGSQMTNCTALGVMLDTIPVTPGHWRQNPIAQYVRMCDLEEACLGGEIAGDTSCANGHTGPVCDLCVQDPLHFGGRGAPCQLCSDVGDPMFTITFYAVGGVVVGQLGLIFDVTYPAFYTETLKSISNINIPFQLLPFGCIFPSLNNFIFDLVLKTATPIILVLMLSFFSKVLRARSGGSGFGVFLADACSDLWFFIIFLVYPSCSTMTFMFFMREAYDEPGEVYVDLMRADRSINREEPLYQSFTAYAIAMLVVYPIGVPLLYALMFHRSRHQLHEMRRIELTLETDFALAKLEAEAAATPEETDEMVRRAIEVHKASGEALENLRGELPTTLRKLTAGYELRTYWFEIFECLRKITLIGLPIFFPPGSPPQLIFGLIICFLSYGAYCVCSPYIRDDDDFLAQVAQVIIFFSLVSSVVTNAFPEDPLMRVLLPALLAVPVILTFIFETPLLEFLRSFTEPDKEGNVGLVGQFILAFRRHTLRITDRLVGAVGQEEAKSGMRAVWEEHSKELGASALWRDTYLAANHKRALAGMAPRDSDARDGVGGGANGSSESISTPELHSTIQSESISTPELHSTAPLSVMTWLANLGSDRGRRGSKEPSEAHLDA
ncbi:cytadherence high molecular weight protein 2 [Chrysochromulina tobinii]|uniref:Cytadherence high molecular weight protein 2 n=1 Tax=Chrysochromulina tobinii TaxID=1460289 RepID=A0A0M0JV02_9EUKA|nr:cytadherence high molecular weight protein 2 [Chrysochromulina tobinii]|eukprot:KOO29948.1 cytadherence high molecular weight protein 2 [Chrysochromulina sp. CCMP291]